MLEDHKLTNYKPPSPKKRQRHSVESGTPHSHYELNLLPKKFEKFYKKFSSPVHNNSDNQQTSTLPTSMYQCYETPIQSHKKPNFQSLQLHTFQPNKRKRSCGISLSRESSDDDPDYHEIPEELILNLPSTRI